jgi:signal transduction histidine kinase/putative methionine-R-sulfoxide reductase with GAF domain
VPKEREPAEGAGQRRGESRLAETAHRARARAARSEANVELRSLAQLNMLHSLATQLAGLTDRERIANAITVELKTIIDYHNCRVYLLAADDVTLEPVAFRGDLTEYEGETYEELVTRVGEGITGHVAKTGASFYTPDAEHVPFAVQIPGTGEVQESMLAVPTIFGERVTGVIVLSKLGYDQFDDGDMRVLEVLASHAAVAFENARLFELEREAAETSSALLGLSQALTGVHDLDAVVRRTLAAVPAIVECEAVAVYLRDPETGEFVLERSGGPRGADLEGGMVIDRGTAAEFLTSLHTPFLLDREILRNVPPEHVRLPDATQVLVAPMRWEPDGFAVLVQISTAEQDRFGDRELRLAGGIADITSLAIGSARRVHELERFHELVESLDATFWEADPETLAFTFLSDRATATIATAGGGRWGDHIGVEDRDAAVATIRSLVDEGGDRSLEYRTRTDEGLVWIRDLVNVVRDARGRASALRGLMIDVTERKRAEQALRNSERKYSEAFRREREATQRLRALDEMKNTFLEAVSHDLRTPLTSILGSALTLEQGAETLSREDARDLVRRVASNARKLERLLADLLDLDRLQRGIISPQRRATDVGAVVRQAVEESDLLAGRRVEIDAPSFVVSVDAAKVERIVENLVANAGRHTPEGSALWVRVEPGRDAVTIVVEDEGPGVPPEFRDAVFEPFRQGPATRSTHAPGVGVGLSLVARFAELHGGRAWVEERPGGGASFRVFLPSA